MAGEKTGRYIIIKVNTGTVAEPTWTPVASQRDASWNPTKAMIDMSSKESKDAKCSPDKRSQTITCDALYVRSGADYAKLLATYEANDEESEKIQVMMSESGADWRWAYGYISDLPHQFPHEGPATYSLTIQIAGGWTEV